jgi:hypothetical protein
MIKCFNVRDYFRINVHGVNSFFRLSWAFYRFEKKLILNAYIWY